MCNRLTAVDEDMLDDHYYLNGDDYCNFIGEYTARKGYSYSDTNQLIANFKKSPKLRGTPQWRYKQQAINQVGRSLATCLTHWADEITLVPIPPSKCKTDAEYDNRMTRALNICKHHIPDIEYRELILQTVSTDAAHLTDERPIPEELIRIYDCDLNLLEGVREKVIIVDDMLTTGCHFKAMQTILRKHLPNNIIAGVFVARRVPDTDMFSAIDGFDIEDL